MLILLIAYLGGALTILSPCILPVLPFVFARAHRPFVSHGLPMLAGMALSFAAIATLAAVGGGWVVELNQSARVVALVLFALFGIALLLPRVAERLSRPLVSLGIALVRTGRLATVAAAAGHRHRAAVGAMRRAHPRLDPDRCSAQWREPRYLAAAARLCGWRGHLAGRGAAVRSSRLHSFEKLARH